MADWWVELQRERARTKAANDRAERMMSALLADEVHATVARAICRSIADPSCVMDEHPDRPPCTIENCAMIEHADAALAALHDLSAGVGAVTDAKRELTIIGVIRCADLDRCARGCMYSRCKAASDGDCFWEDCPQHIEHQGHCPLDLCPFRRSGETPT